MPKYIIHYYITGAIPPAKSATTLLHGNVEYADIDKYYETVKILSPSEIPPGPGTELDRIFQLFNSSKCPLFDSASQKFLKDNKLHGSMSVGDVIQYCKDDGKSQWYAVASLGFNPIHVPTS